MSSSTSPSPWWWLLVLVLAGAVVALVLLAVRGRRARTAWEASLAGAVEESTWLGRALVPDVLSAGDAPRDVWSALRPRVEALDSRLTRLTASAPRDRVDSLDRLRTAVAEVSSAVDAYVAASAAEARERLGAARQAQRQLEQALRAFESGQPPG